MGRQEATLRDETELPEEASGSGSLLVTLRRRILVVICTCLAVAGTAYFLSTRQEKQYEASALVVIREPPLDPRSVLSPLGTGGPRDPDLEAATNALLVGTRPVRQRTAQRLGVDPSLIDVEAKQREETTAVDVTATAPDPVFAARVANVFAEEFIARRRKAEQAKLRRALASVMEAGRLAPAARQGFYRERADQLRVLAKVQTGGAELAERAVPAGTPISPRPRRNALLGALFGLLLGGAIALLREQADRRVRDVSELGSLADLPVLGSIPASRALGSKDDPGPGKLLPAEEEAFGVLQANTRYFKPDLKVRSVVITSAVPAEGKTTVAWHLSYAAASAGARVLLIETDVRQPRIAHRHGLLGGAGLNAILSGEAAAGEIVQQVPVSRRNGQGPSRAMDVIVAGPPAEKASDLIASERMRETIRAAHDRYDFVVLDAQPIGIVSDAIPLLREVDGAIVVTYLGKSTREQVAGLLTQLRNLEVRVLGIVANGTSRRENAYGYASSRSIAE